MQAQQANRAGAAFASASATTSASPASAHHLLGSVRLGLFLGRPHRRR